MPPSLREVHVLQANGGGSSIINLKLWIVISSHICENIQAGQKTTFFAYYYIFYYFFIAINKKKKWSFVPNAPQSP